MKAVISSSNGQADGAVDPRFGRCAQFLIFDSETSEWNTGSNEQNLRATQGAGIQAAQNALNLGADIVITGHIGPKAFHVLNSANVAIYLAENMSAEEAWTACQENKLAPITGSDVEGHWA